MAEIKIYDITFRRTDDGEIEITQGHIEYNKETGVLLPPDQVALFIKKLEQAVREFFPDLHRD